MAIKGESEIEGVLARGAWKRGRARGKAPRDMNGGVERERDGV